MHRRAVWSILAAGAAWSLPAPSSGQVDPQPDVIVDLNEAIFNYLQGPIDYEAYQRGIQKLDEVLRADPENSAGLLFRALTHGRLGLVEQETKLAATDEVANHDALVAIREAPARLAEIQARHDELKRKLDDSTLEGWRRLLIDQEFVEHANLLEQHEKTKTQSLEELKQGRLAYKEKAQQASLREREHYRLMNEDLERLVQSLREPEAVIRLLEVVSRSKVARIDEERAASLLAGELDVDRPADEARQLREFSSRTLHEVAELLELLLARKLEGEEPVRVRFFLGVIRFRQAVPRRAPDEEAKAPDPGLLQTSRQLMEDLADGPAADGDLARWRSYASLYLGLILPLQSQRESDPQRREAMLADAEQRLQRAAQLDTATEDGIAYSLSDRAIQIVVNRQTEQIARVRELPAVAEEPINDFQLSVVMGAHYDSNVVLLGERTDLPRDISDERDFGFTLGTVLDYTLSLGKLDRRLDRWTIGIRGRTTQLWHCDVDEFDEQRYGGSAAIQYELLEEEERVGPVYLRLQYDYDYILLGRKAFLDYHTLSPNIQAFWNGRRAETDLYFRYEIRDYHEPLYNIRFDRDGEYYAIGALQSYKLLDMTPIYEKRGIEPWGLKGDPSLQQDDPEWPAHWLEVFGGFQYSWDSTEGDEFDQKAYTLTSGFLVPLPYGFLFDATMQFEWEDYAHGSRVDYHRNGRNDFIQEYGVGLSRTFVLREGKPINRYTPAIDRLLMTVRGHATWTHDDSNVVDRLGQAVFSYDRVLYGITVAFTLN